MRHPVAQTAAFIVTFLSLPSHLFVTLGGQSKQANSVRCEASELEILFRALMLLGGCGAGKVPRYRRFPALG
jgi:hypothetical protein